MAETDQEKTEAPTLRRLADARRDGNVARSTDLTAAFVLLASIVLLDVLGPRMMLAIKTNVEAVLAGHVGSNVTRSDGAGGLMSFIGYRAVSGIVPIMFGLAFVALAATLMQVGFLLTSKPLEPDITKLSPLKGIKNILGARGAVRFVMSLGKLIIVAIVGTIVIFSEIPRILLMTELEIRPLVVVAWELLYWLAIKLALALMILAVLDYLYQRWQRQQDLKMTKHEVKEEMKRMDGDPQVRERRRRVARQMAMQRTAQAVPRADVVVTNPTHFAVALQYDPARMASPKVIAKGADYMALRIRQLAMTHDVPLVERKSLARALYGGVEVGQEIPPQFFAAVAEILAYVYRLSGRRIA